MATYTDLINQVLRRMREDEVSTYDETPYSKLIGDFVNEAKREVEDSWKWSALRTTVVVTTAASSNNYVLTGAGNRFKYQDPNLSVYNATNLSYLTKANAQDVKQQLLGSPGDGTPEVYYIEGVDASGNARVYFFQVPDGIYTINFGLVVPQADLAASGTILTIPEWPVILGAYVKALDERGEDNGGSMERAQGDYQKALADAIQIDSSFTVDENDWAVE